MATMPNFDQTIVPALMNRMMLAYSKSWAHP